MPQILRTPDDRFQNLPDFPFQPHYLEVNGLRMHYLDEGAGEVILCLHGEPSWSYLYRHMIPILVRAGFRVIAPDWIGFGRSDKYADRADYTFAMHAGMLRGFIEGLNLQNITAVMQDWGGLLGLNAARELPERFARLVIMNTGLPTGEEPMPEGFILWQKFSQRRPDMPIGFILQSATTTDLSPDILVAYEAPFPDASYKAGALQFPLLVPTAQDMPGAAEMKATRRFLANWRRPALVMFSDKDPVTVGGDRFFRRLIPSAAEQPEITIHDAGHFLQEDKGAEIAEHVVAFMNRTPLNL